MTIDEANTKILRPAMDVVVQVEINSAEISQLTATNAYSQGEVGQTDLIPILMDLSNGGFLNNGAAVPLGDDYIVSTIGSPLVITATTDSTKNLALTAIGYVDGQIKKWQTAKTTSSTKTLTIPANNKRIIITSVVIGDIWRFDNSNLVECSGVLRGVETKVENPELQMSEIEIKAYMPNDITNDIGSIGTDHPILYTAGYPGDMSPVRKFYMSEQIEWEDNVITIKGTDATRFLDDEYAVYVGNADGYSGGINRYISQIHTLLNNSNVTHEYHNDYNVSPYTNGSSFLIPKISKRKVISQAVNLFRFIGYGLDFEDLPIYINYVDAGIPKLWTGKSDEIKEIKQIGKPQILVEPVIGTIKMNNLFVDRGSSKTIETVSISGSTIREVSEPYYSFSTSAGTITKISPYVYKLVRSGSATVSGVPLRIYDPSDVGEFSPIVVNRGNGGVTVTLDDLAGLQGTVGDGEYETQLIDLSMRRMFDRSNILYKFEYRGDPRLQPRDYIKADVDGSETLTNMTIDSIEFSHEGGGYKQKIIARKGLV